MAKRQLVSQEAPVVAQSKSNLALFLGVAVIAWLIGIGLFYFDANSSWIGLLINAAIAYGVCSLPQNLLRSKLDTHSPNSQKLLGNEAHEDGKGVVGVFLFVPLFIG